MKQLFILGASGSIGTQTLDVVKKYPDLFKVIGLSFGRTEIDCHEIIETLEPEIVCFRDQSQALQFAKGYPNVKFVFGDSGLLEIARYPKTGILVNALMGSIGLIPTIEAIKTKKDIALANKETLVMAGQIIKKLVKDYQVSLLPIDSEHNALLQALNGENIEQVKELMITASGGSFRHLSRSELSSVTKMDALKHPNWTMGAKITIDSATMMNKGLEVIEAHYLFDLPYDRIKTIIHKESIIHGMVTFNDESVKAVLGYPDMRMPILYALTYPKHLKLDLKTLDFNTLSTLTFEPMNYNRYPLLKLAYEVGDKGGLYPVVMNAANEKAVKLFLEDKISFLDIEQLVIKAVQKFKDNIANPSIDQILACNKDVYESVGI